MNDALWRSCDAKLSKVLDPTLRNKLIAQQVNNEKIALFNEKKAFEKANEDLYALYTSGGSLPQNLVSGSQGTKLKPAQITELKPGGKVIEVKDENDGAFDSLKKIVKVINGSGAAEINAGGGIGLKANVSQLQVNATYIWAGGSFGYNGYDRGGLYFDTGSYTSAELSISVFNVVGAGVGGKHYVTQYGVQTYGMIDAPDWCSEDSFYAKANLGPLSIQADSSDDDEDSDTIISIGTGIYVFVGVDVSISFNLSEAKRIWNEG